jgi:hypothetical protein
MLLLKKSIIFDIEQRYFLLNKINLKPCNYLLYRFLINLFYINQQNLITI